MMTAGIEGDALNLVKFTKATKSSTLLERQEPNMPAGYVACSMPKARTRTASPLVLLKAQAIGEATEIIRRGEADTCRGGAHSMIHPFGVTGFNLLTALSTNNEDPTQGFASV
ncbi:MAG: hypothetical protein U0894_03190 [Pirellulales bacterium]